MDELTLANPALGDRTFRPEKRQRQFGTPSDPEKWEQKTESINNPMTYLTYGRRQHMLVEATLGREDKFEGTVNALGEWLKVNKDSKNFYRELGKDFNALGIAERNLMDIGAGAGASLGFFDRSGIFPKRLILVEPDMSYYKYLNSRVESLTQPGGGEPKYEMVEHKDVDLEAGHTLYKLRNKETGQNFEIECINKTAGNGNIKLVGNEQADGVMFSGVAKYYKPAMFRNIIDGLGECVKPNAKVTFSFTMEDSPKLDAKLHKFIKGHDSKNPYTQNDMEQTFSKRCKQSYGDNYVCTV